jgi:CDP-diacylglycerol---glycerol-3-phosphate 3-phosphatidyltransferase
MNLPNILTLSRIVLAVVLIFLLEERSSAGNILAAVVFAIASLTDFYDGHLAKKMGLVSDFGKIMDPIADKILILSTFGVLADIGMIAWWMFIVIAVREVLVTASRLVAMRQGQVLAAERAGKVKTVVQIIAILAILLYLVAARHFEPDIQRLWLRINDMLVIWAVIMTIYSGMDYFRKGSR